MLKIFHISDLHYTAAASGQLRDSSVAGVRGLLELAETLRANGTLAGKVSVVITGDLVQSGSSPAVGTMSDLEAVNSALIQPLMRTLDLSPEHVFIVPGNHEMDRLAVEEAARLKQGQYAASKVCESDLHDDLRSKLGNYFNFIEAEGYRSVSAAQPRIATFEVDGQQIVCFNGLAGSYSRQGYGDKGELFVLDSELGNAFSVIAKNSVVLTHHPLSWYADGCATNLKEFLSSRECRLLTGHIHDRGIEWVETRRGGFALVQAGASAEVGSPNQVAVSWLPPSNSAAVRHYSLDVREGRFGITPASATEVAPSRSKDFFEKTEAFFDPAIITAAAEAAAKGCEADLHGASCKRVDGFVPPDLSLYPADQFSGRRTTLTALEADANNRFVSGDELSGKSSFLHYLAARINAADCAERRIAVVLDFRVLQAGHHLTDTVIKRLAGLSLSKRQAEYLLSIGRVELLFDNFDPDASVALASFKAFFSAHPAVRWTIATRGDQKYMPSQAPVAFPKEGISYYQLSETTLPTVLKMIERHEAGKALERPRAIVEQVFRSINNLRAPRTIFYVNSMVEVFLSDGSVEPLNRYLLIENLLSDRIRSAHREMLPNQPVDMEMLETFIGQIAHHLMEREEPYLSKADFYQLVETFVAKKGIQRKRFNPDTILEILTRSFVLRDYEFGYGFMMLSVEDYFLAKHMGRDEAFRAKIMSTEGLLTYPSVAEYYVAQNPSDRPRIEQILRLLDDFVEEVAPLLNEIEDSSRATIREACPGAGSQSLQDGLIERLGKIEGVEDPTSVRFEDPVAVGRTKRLRFAAEERGAVLLQLGASILGVTRTLDQADRVEIFKRLRPVLLTSMHALPMVAEHLAKGGEIRYRGINIKADYVGELAIEEDRFYLILRSMMFSLLRNFGTWAGSPSFFNAAVDLREEEEDELVRSALYAQNIEADLSEALDFIPEITDGLESLILREIMIRLFVEALTLVPLERADEARALERLVEETVKLNPPKAKDEATINSHKARLRQAYSDRIGYNAYIGRIVKGGKRLSSTSK